MSRARLSPAAAQGVRRTAATLGLALLSALSVLLGGCSFIGPRVEVADTRPEPLTAPAVVAPGNGSIFQANQYRPLFEDHRARLPGDSLTVQIAEKVNATQSSTSSVDKTGTLSGSVTALPGVRPAAFARATAEGTSANTFAGKGTTENSNDFSGTITVLVRGVLPNGHLLIAGEKQIGVNQNVDVLRFSGQVDPRAIQAGNTVPSSAIANVRLEQRGRGAQAEAQAVGWLSRIFLNVMPI